MRPSAALRNRPPRPFSRTAGTDSANGNPPVENNNGRRAHVRAYETHPLAAAFPPQAPEVYAALVKDVAENGLAAPVVLHEGRVLDGVHRLRACLEAGVEPETVVYGGDDPAGFVVR